MSFRDTWRTSGLPIHPALPAVCLALREAGQVVVHAPPGAGKTTIVPLALLEEPWRGQRRILMLEPRRLAARAAAHRMAQLLGEPVGLTVGYRTRLDTRVSGDTRIEVVTEGILTRMVQDDATLDGFAAVLFDEFHERSLNADLGLALVLHSRRLVRPDLRIVVMSATLDGTAVSRLLAGAPVVTTSGTAHHVETRYRPLATTGRRMPAHDPAFAAGVANAIGRALVDTPGDLLAFLPGAGEIRRVARALESESLPSSTDVIPLHGTLRPEEQDRAIRPSPIGRRKVVLATSIAETSLTIDGIRIVVDAGLSRRPRFSPRTGMSRLETVRVSRAAADQRRGRAGRTAPGVCHRLWDEAGNAELLPFVPPEILEGDLAPLALDLAVAGIADAGTLDWLDAPPATSLQQARELLRQLGAIDANGIATVHGREMASLGMHPRLAHMVVRTAHDGNGALACDVAALLGERDPLRGTGPRIDGTAGSPVSVDIRERIDAVHGRHPRSLSVDRGILQRAREQSRRWQAQVGVKDANRDGGAVGRVIALAFPDRVAQRRPGPAARYLLRNGTGAVLPDGDALARDAFLVIAETDGRKPEARVFLAASLSEADLAEVLADQVHEVEVVTWEEERGLTARLERCLGAIVLGSRVVRNPSPEATAGAVAAAIRRLGLDVLPWSEGAVRLRERLAFLHHHDAGWPDVSDAALLATLLASLEAELARVRSRDDLSRLDVTAALAALLTWEQRAALDRLAPTHFRAPTGSRVPIGYANPEGPVVSIRLQELFGTGETPTVLDGRVPVTLHLLSPAHRPVQVTRDLAGFWRSSYFDVRKDLRARYPKHPWPDDPRSAEPTTRARRRG
jgi:ATP-dependent helicase HrpB